LADLMSAIDYEHGCSTAMSREAESKWSNVSDFVGWISNPPPTKKPC
jgi:hypothetical protein